MLPARHALLESLYPFAYLASARFEKKACRQTVSVARALHRGVERVARRRPRALASYWLRLAVVESRPDGLCVTCRDWCCLGLVLAEAGACQAGSGAAGSRSRRLTQWLLVRLQDKLDAGNEIVFTQVGSTLKVQVPNAQKDFASAALCKAMFDIYLGDTPVSPKGKDAMAEVPCPSHLAPLTLALGVAPVPPVLSASALASRHGASNGCCRMLTSWLTGLTRSCAVSLCLLQGLLALCK